MKFDDSDKDYFLHDFSEEQTDDSPARPSSSTPSDGQSGQTDDSASPSFDFSNPSGEGTTGVDVKPKRRHRKVLVWFFVIVFAVLGVTVWIRYFVPYVTESQVTGYVTLVEKRGIIFRTFEGEMVSESRLADKGNVYSRDVYFSIPDDDMARRLQQYQGSGTPVTITCKRYYGTLPWRGASNNVMVSFTPKN